MIDSLLSIKKIKFKNPLRELLLFVDVNKQQTYSYLLCPALNYSTNKGKVYFLAAFGFITFLLFYCIQIIRTDT